jgi:uncharacterized protein
MDATTSRVTSVPRWRTSHLWLGLGLELVFVLGLWLADAHRLVPLSKTPFLLLLAWASLRLRRVSWSGLGLAAPANWPRAIAIGTLTGIGIELLATFVTTPLLSSFFGADPDLSDLRPIVGNVTMLIVFLALNWTLAAFGEELAFRGYWLNRVAGVVATTRGGHPSWIMSLLIVSVFFGLQHQGQGITGIVQEGFSGFLLGLIYLMTGRNLVTPMIAHGVSNTLAMVLIYFNRYPGL